MSIKTVRVIDIDQLILVLQTKKLEVQNLDLEELIELFGVYSYDKEY